MQPKYPFPTTFRDAMELPPHEFKRLFGQQVIKGWHDVRQIEAILCTYQPQLIVELGTGSGIHTLYMGIWAHFANAKLVTFDKEFPPLDVGRLLQILEVEEFAGDIWNECWGEGRKERLDQFLTREYFSDSMAGRSFGKTLLYCDNGDKPREVQTFAPLLKRGDMCVVHDWRHEIQPEDVEPLIDGHVLAYHERGTWETTGTHMGFVRL